MTTLRIKGNVEKPNPNNIAILITSRHRNYDGKLAVRENDSKLGGLVVQQFERLTKDQISNVIAFQETQWESDLEISQGAQCIHLRIV